MNANAECLSLQNPGNSTITLQRDKRLVAQQFSRAAHSYDQAAGIQLQVRNQLLSRLQRVNGPLFGHWLDIGCGTGLTLPRLQQLGAQQVCGIDLAFGMIRSARRFASPTIGLLQADADQIPLADASCDGLFSSLMLQWSEQPHSTLQEWTRVLKPGGTLALATLLPGTQRELLQAWRSIDDKPHVNNFISAADLQQALLQAGLRSVSRQQSLLQEHYDSLTSLLRNLKAIGATNVNPGRKSGLGGRRALQQLDNAYPRDRNGLLPLSYQVQWLLLRKE